MAWRWLGETEERSSVESHTAHTLFRAAIAFAVVGVVRRLFIVPMAARPCRIKLLRNGLSSGGKVCILPDSFEELLSRCSTKFSGGADSDFVARRLFTLEGFELEEAEEVIDGDTVVVSGGEDFIQPSPPPMALQPSLASHSTLSSGGSASELQALALGQEERLLTPRRAESSSSCASSRVTIPATPSSSERSLSAP